MKLGIAGIGSKIYLSDGYSRVFLKTLKGRYRNFAAKHIPMAAEFYYKGLPNKYAFDSFLRVAYSTLLLRHNGFLLHASGVISRGKGYIFTGVSGAGKTTVAEESKLCGMVLSDEIVAVKKAGGCWKLFGTPFMGLMRGGGKNRSAARPRLLFLKQAKTNVYNPISTEKAWAKLLRNVILFKPEKKIAGLAFDFLHTADKGILKFRKKGFWRVLWDTKWKKALPRGK